MENVRELPRRSLLSFTLPLSLLLLVVLLAALPVFAPNYVVVLLTDIFMYVIITVSWATFSGPTGYISLATAAFFGIGVYALALFGMTLPLPAIVAIGGAASFLLALVVGALTLRLTGIYFAMFTFGLIELIRNVLLWWEVNKSGTVGRIVLPVDHATAFRIVLGILVVLLLTTFLLRRSRFGLALRSIGECEEAAAHVGVNVTVLKTLTFAMTAFFVGATGAIIATRWTYIDPRIAFNPLYSFLPVLMAMFGGMGELYGPIIGAAIFTYLEEVLITRMPYHYMLLFGIVLLIVILFLPDGLVGLIQRWRKGGLAGQRANSSR